MKKVFVFILSLIFLLNFTTIVNAASSSITAKASSTKYEYVDGLEIYYNYTGSYPLYILDRNTYFNSSTTLRDPYAIPPGYQYIINNSNPISNSSKNYYITQVALLWYVDYLAENNDNISLSLKEYISSNTSDTVCYYINKLVNDAKHYNDEERYINFTNQDIYFTKSGSYYYSNEINVSTNDLSSTPTIGVYNAPSSTIIVSSTVKADGEGSFKIRIPVSSLNNYTKDDFEVYIKGNTKNNTAYLYSNYGSDLVIYGYNYSGSNTSVEESIPVILDDFLSNYNVSIKVTDKNNNAITGIKYNVYKEDCRNTTCSSSNLVDTFTSSKDYVEINGITNTGYYTFVKTTNNSYDLYEKEVVYVNDYTGTQSHIFKEIGEYNSDVYKNVTIYNSLNDYSNVIKVYKTDGTLVNSYRSSETSQRIKIYSGNYYIVDSDDTILVYFEIDNNGDLYITEGSRKVKYNSIDLDNYYKRYTQDDIIEDDEYIENDTNNDYYVDEDGIIHIDNLDGVDNIEISTNVDTTTDVKIDWISNIIDCPITSVTSTIKYIIGTIILVSGIILTIKNVKKSKNNI